VKLLVVRHALAGDREEWARQGKDDRKRPLTAEGRRKMREAARGLAALSEAPEVLATSPLVRARDTAAILARAFRVEEVEELSALSPQEPPQALLAWLRARARDELAAVVGHEPHLGMLVSWLLSGRPRSFLELKKGGACLLDLGARPGPGRASLLWLLPPSALRPLGR